MAAFASLTIELRLTVYRLALTPEPGVCTFSVYDYLRRSPMYGAPLTTAGGNAVWPVPKRRFAAIAHVCREFHDFALRFFQQDYYGHDNYCAVPTDIPDPTGLSYYVGRATRPLQPDTDMLFINTASDLLELLSILTSAS
ncbi:hypothetical protein M406DRAFT_355369, partial [Cryphonectria parasitica EP155]